MNFFANIKGSKIACINVNNETDSINSTIDNSLGAEVPEINYSYTGLESESVSANSTYLPDFNISNLKGLKIANLNVNSLLKHIDEIRMWLFEKPFDILAINKSKIDPTIRDSEIIIQSFVLIVIDLVVVWLSI